MTGGPNRTLTPLNKVFFSKEVTILVTRDLTKITSQFIMT